jgi:hypothetical protein
VITIYSMTMLIWGSRYQWTLASTLIYVGFAGWAIGGTGAVIDSIIPINFRLHNTTWVVAHFHTYLILCVVVWVFAFLAHLLERDAGRTTRRSARLSAVVPILVGGYGLTGTWFVEGALGVPRRYALQPAGTSGYSLVGAGFALLLALGFLALVLQLVPLARTAWAGRHRFHLVEHVDSWTGGRYQTSRREDEVDRPPVALAARRGLPLSGPRELAVAAAACVAGLASFFPQVVDASEASTRYHHLDHAGHFFFGAALGLLLGSLPAVSQRLGERANLGLATVLVAPMVMMLVMVPRFYEPLERHPPEHALYHLAMAGFGFLTGLAATRLGRVAGITMFVLSVGMPLMFAAAMT